MSDKVIIYTDGGCEPNPGVGGWAALLIFDDISKELSGGELDSTNNRMELTAVITALESLSKSHEIDLYTDSQYVQKGITEWIKTWIKKNWRGVKNPDLWQRLYDEVQRHRIKWHWVKGHAGDKYNERVDRLAMSEIRKLRGEAPLKAIEAENNITIYTITDYGSWEVRILDDKGEKKLSGKEAEANSYKMAIQAAISALESIPVASSIVFFTNNETFQKGITQWIHGWLKKGWITSTGEPVKHKDLWIRLYNASKNHKIAWKLQN